MAKFKAFWNYQKKKTGEIVIAEEELQEMLDAAWGAGYNQGRAETASPRIIIQRGRRPLVNAGWWMNASAAPGGVFQSPVFRCTFGSFPDTPLLLSR